MADEVKAPLSTVDSQTPAKKAPDAILYPDSFRVGHTIGERLQSIQDRLGPILGGKIDHPAVQIVGKGWMAHRGSREGICYSSFDWVEQPDGTFHGTKKTEPS